MPVIWVKYIYRKQYKQLDRNKISHINYKIQAAVDGVAIAK